MLAARILWAAVTGVSATSAVVPNPAGSAGFLELNERLARQWPVIAKRKDPLPDAELWKGRSNKLAVLAI